jgi:hypothetical protein
MTLWPSFVVRFLRARPQGNNLILSEIQRIASLKASPSLDFAIPGGRPAVREAS